MEINPSENPETNMSTSIGSYCEWKRKVNLAPPPTRFGQLNDSTNFKVNPEEVEEHNLSLSDDDVVIGKDTLAKRDHFIHKVKELDNNTINNTQSENNQINKHDDVIRTETGAGDNTNYGLNDFERKHIYNYYETLQHTLYETNLPETLDRTSEPRTKLPDSGITIVFLSTPEECLPTLFEGGRRCPGDMLLVMSPSWLETRPSDKDTTLKTMYVHKAITMESAGRTYIDVFCPPRRVTYFVNFFTRALTHGHRDDGEDLEKNLDCPMSSSLSLIKWTDDKLWTRILMAKNNVHVPETLAFWFKLSKRYETLPAGCDIEMVQLESTVDMEKLVSDKVHQFIKRLSQDYQKVVVKPSGVMWNGCRGVCFHNVTDLEQVIQNVVELIKQLGPEDGVLVEVFHAPDSPDPDLERLSFRIRTTVCRGSQDNAITTAIICTIASKSVPINGEESAPQSLETTLSKWGLTASDIEKIREELTRGSERVLEAVIEQERTMTDEERGGIEAQTDIIGIDFVLGCENGKIFPVGIEVNSQNCTFNCQLYEFLNPELSGQCVAPLVTTMCIRSQSYMMSGKAVVVIGSGGWFHELESIIEDLKLKIILVDGKPHNKQRDEERNDILVLQYDFHDHHLDHQHLHHITHLLKDWTVHGCCSFHNDCLPLTSSICDAFSLKRMGTNDAHIIRSRKQVQDKLASKTAFIPHFVRTYHYSLQCFELKSLADLIACTKELGFPCVLQSHSCSSVSSKILGDTEDCIVASKELEGLNMDSNTHQLILMPYVKGSEHYVVVVIFRRKLLRAFVCDKEKLSGISEGKELTCLRSDQIGQVRTAAYQCCTELGFTDGVFMVKMILSNIGPKFIKFYPSINRDIHVRIIERYNVNLLKCSLMIACAIKPILLH